jgi:hypothetical protein
MALSKLAIHYLEEFRDIIEQNPPLSPARLESALYNEDDSLSAIPVRQIILLYSSATNQGKIIFLVTRDGRARAILQDDISFVILFEADINFDKYRLPTEENVVNWIEMFLSLKRGSYPNLEIEIKGI